MKLIMLGAPGAGKGTQAAILSRLLDIPTISTGNILRSAIKEGTPVGLKAKSLMDAGQLVPDDVIMDLMAQRLSREDCRKGYILDGVPRTIAQAEALEEMGIRFDAALSLEVPDSEIEKRMTGRRVCTGCGATYHVESAPPRMEGVCDRCQGPLEQREDDKLETVRRRLEVFRTETAPLKDFYAAKGILRKVENRSTIQETTEAVLKALKV